MGRCRPVSFFMYELQLVPAEDLCAAGPRIEQDKREVGLRSLVPQLQARPWAMALYTRHSLKGKQGPRGRSRIRPV